jgi:hypothetical protein
LGLRQSRLHPRPDQKLAQSVVLLAEEGSGHRSTFDARR